MSAPVPVVVIGVGRVARAVHLRLLPDLPDDLTLAAVVDTDPGRARAADRAGLPVVADIAAAVRAGARAAICATPWPTHVRVVGECLDRRIPVLCEKPVSLDPAELVWLRERERATGLTVTVGYMKRHDPVVEHFVELARAADDEARLVSVQVVDPNAPHQVSHLLPSSVPGLPPATGADGDRAVGEILGPGSDPAVRAAYAHGLGGSLIHHVNLVNAVLDGSDGLAGRIRYASQWDGGRAVTGEWQPSARLTVRLCHVWVPRHRRYRETVELVTESGWTRLSLPSPYSRDEGAVLVTERWDAAGALNHRSTITGATAQTGFLIQLRRWAAALRGDGRSALPGLPEAERDLRVVLEAAAVLAARTPGRAAEPVVGIA